MGIYQIFFILDFTPGRSFIQYISKNNKRLRKLQLDIGKIDQVDGLSSLAAILRIKDKDFNTV